MSDVLRQAALDYHAHPTPGKVRIALSKPMTTQYDLSLAYSPGVAEPVKEIAQDPAKAYQYTNKGNLVAVISNGTAVLGLGNMGALASKPVMEGKAALFKRFADIDVYDIEIDCNNQQDLVDTIARLAPTFGGINIEDIKAPECFYVEAELKKRLSIPVLHDDQQGTAIVVAAALLNALEIQNKKLSAANIVCLGAGAAGIATMRLLRKLGASLEKLFVIDREGVIHIGRQDLNEQKKEFAIRTEKRTLADAMQHADVFIGVSGPNLVTPDMVKTMAKNPVIFALSNPIPEIMPEEALRVRDDVILATGRSDYPNQVNNVLCFPYLFRGALDVRATTINEPMQLAAVHAIRSLAKEPIPEEVLAAYGIEQGLVFGPAYLIPKPTDPRLKEKVSSAVAKAAIESGVAQI
ncbi:NADP-dependent malic enzyme [Aquicella lusitana]|uniref:NADP-dependent malic enzyme n=2 Tax=Aquicella lusitana TaxID=254246 RepID=A0A370GTH4_9COXI|nr:malic enzyme-like NAD(P)-binding protein [Aquicella lusitana]RDI45223.1 malate dehydrogenase (oxaloacetate-decarboxylating)(NADP+) [Aquicella lusitana]VVC72707.1 NADP-dependent malic enzyme [Aquicella lusitana]